MSSELFEKILSQIIPKRDVFETSDFDAISFINENFPSEKSLENVDGMYSKVRKSIQHIQNDLHSTLRESSVSEDNVDLEISQNTIRTLFKNIETIQSKASEAEELVDQITKDIKVLDQGKKNLTLTISTFQKLRMFVESHRKLSQYVKTRDYANVAAQLSSLNSFVEYFGEYEKVDRIRELIHQVNLLKQNIENQVRIDFRSFFLKKKEEELQKDTQEGMVLCNVVNGLKDSVRNDLLSEFVDLHMKKYETIFQKKGYQGLEKLSKRFKWMKRMLVYYQRYYETTFPSFWMVDALMVAQFCILTVRDVQQYLEEFSGFLGKGKKKNNKLTTSSSSLSSSSSSFDSKEEEEKEEERMARILVKGIRNTLQFEQEMHSRFHFETDWEKEKKEEERMKELKRLKEKKREAKKVKGSNSVSVQYQLIKRIKELEKEISEAQKEKIKQQQQNNEQQQQESSSTEKKQKQKQQSNFHFLGMISHVFEEYMSIYIEFERKTMNRKIIEIIKKEEWNPTSIHHSGEDLFIYIEESLRTCQSISSGKTLFDLYSLVFQKEIQFFVSSLMNQLPKIHKEGSRGTVSIPFKMFSNTNPLTDDEILKVCHILHLVDYCRNEMNQTKEFLMNTIHPLFKNKISFKEEHSKFYHLQKQCIQILVTNINNQIEAQAFNGIMIKVNWSMHEDVRDESEYITLVKEFTKREMKRFIKYVKWDCFRMFLDLFHKQFCALFVHFVYKCKKLSTPGVQQFLLDIATLSTFLMGLIKLHPEFEENDDYEEIYKKYVGKSMKRLGNIFKVLQAPAQSILQTYKEMFPKGNQEEFNQIIQLKGLKNEEQSNILSKFSLKMFRKMKN